MVNPLVICGPSGVGYVLLLPICQLTYGFLTLAMAHYIIYLT